MLHFLYNYIILCLELLIYVCVVVSLGIIEIEVSTSLSESEKRERRSLDLGIIEGPRASNSSNFCSSQVKFVIIMPSIFT